jgi:glycosyltransferase involved in cell wall biosynthesis
MRRLLRKVARGLRLTRLTRGPVRPWESLVALLQAWKMDGVTAPTGRPARPSGRIGYVLLRGPGLTDTFVRREVRALRDAGVTIELFARDAGAGHADTMPVTCWGPMDRVGARAATARFLRARPMTVIRLALYIIRHRHHESKTWRRDLDVLYDAAQLAMMLDSRGVTWIHAPWANHAALLAFVAARLLGIPYSVQARASEIHRTAEAPRVADRVRGAEFIITNSEYNARYLRGLCPAPETPPVHVIANGLDLSRFTPVRSRVTPMPLRLLAVGRLVEPKGFVHLLSACDQLRARGLAFTCEVIGGPQDDFDTLTWVELRRVHTALRLETLVCFRGEQPLEEIMRAYERADIFVLPCVRGRDGSHDITPNSLIEAMAMGLPVISTTSGAIPEIVEDGVSGVLVAPGDPGELARAIVQLAVDPASRARLGCAARRKVELQFDASRNARARVALFGNGPAALALEA